MLKNSKKGLLFTTLIFFVSIYTTASQQAMALNDTLGCEVILRVTVNDITQLPTDGKATQCFEVVLTSPGYLSVEVTAPERNPQLKLGFLGEYSDRSGFEARDGDTIVQLVSGMIIRSTRPGTFRFRAAAQNPAVKLAEAHVQVGFTENLHLRTRSSSSYDTIYGEEDSDVDPNLGPNGFVPGPKTSYETTYGEEDSDVDPNLGPNGFVPGPKTSSDTTYGEEDSDVDPNLGPNGFVPGPTSSSETAYGEDDSDVDPNLNPHRFVAPARAFDFVDCRDLVDDDHGSGFLCATALRSGEQLIGELHRADDVDTLSFVLQEQNGVRLEIVGDLDMLYELYDQNGHRLAARRGDEVSSATTLNPGRYFVRISASAEQAGYYALALQTSIW